MCTLYNSEEHTLGSAGNSLNKLSDTRHQVLIVVSPDEKLPAQVPQENSSPETTKQAGRAQKQLGGMYRVNILVQG